MIRYSMSYENILRVWGSGRLEVSLQHPPQRPDCSARSWPREYVNIKNMIAGPSVFRIDLGGCWVVLEAPGTETDLGNLWWLSLTPLEVKGLAFRTA